MWWGLARNRSPDCSDVRIVAQPRLPRHHGGRQRPRRRDDDLIGGIAVKGGRSSASWPFSTFFAISQIEIIEIQASPRARGFWIAIWPWQ